VYAGAPTQAPQPKRYEEKRKMKNNITRTFLVFVILFSIYSCETKNEYTKIDSSDKRINIEGLSLLPPQGEGWHIKKKHAGSIQFAKLGGTKDQSIVGLAELSKLPEIKSKEEFLALISKQRAGKPTPNRFEVVLNKEELSKENNDYCVRFHTILKDYGAKNLPKTSDFLITEDIGLICRHPDNKKIGVTIALSQRTKSENKINNFKSIANEFISDAKFVPFSKTNTELGLAAFREQAYEKAIKNFNKAIAENPKDHSAYFYRGFCCYDQKNYPSALSDWKKVISLKKDYIEAHVNIASIYLENKDYEQALIYVNEAIKYASSLSEEEQHSREVPTAYKMRMEINYELKEYDKVIQDGRYLVRLGDQEWYVYNNLVSDIVNHSTDIDRTECVALLKKAEDLASEEECFAYINTTYGELFSKLDESNKALDYFNKAFNQSNDPIHKKEIKEKISKIRP